MSWHYLQGQEEASWADACLDGAPSALLSLMPTPDGSSLPDRETGSWSGSPSGTTSKPLTATDGAERLTSSLEGSRAKTSAVQAKAKALEAAARVYGATWRGSFARWDRNLCLWRTAQCSLLGGLALYSETWPRWGIMRGGACSELDTLAPRINETASGLRLATPTATANQLSPSMMKHPGCRAWATPTGRDWKDSPGMSFQRPDGRSRLDLLPRQVYHMEKERNGGAVAHGMRLNPPWVAWLMGWPIGWTDCEPLGMDRFRLWLRLHGKY